jgi:hypothetical protein
MDVGFMLTALCGLQQRSSSEEQRRREENGGGSNEMSVKVEGGGRRLRAATLCPLGERDGLPGSRGCRGGGEQSGTEQGQVVSGAVFEGTGRLDLHPGQHNLDLGVADGGLGFGSDRRGRGGDAVSGETGEHASGSAAFAEVGAAGCVKTMGGEDEVEGGTARQGLTGGGCRHKETADDVTGRPSRGLEKEADTLLRWGEGGHREQTTDGELGVLCAGEGAGALREDQLDGRRSG